MKFFNNLKDLTQFTLNESEREFKHFYDSSTGYDLTSPCSLENIQHFFEVISHDDSIFPRLTLDHMLETAFFENGMNVAVYRHLRYLPPIYHQHAFFELVCVISGNCINYLGDQEFHMIPGDICIIPPNTKHALSVFQDECIVINILLRTSTFEKTFLGPFSESDILSNFFTQTLYHIRKNSYLICRTNNNSDVLNFVFSAYEEYEHNQRYKNRMLVAIISTFFIALLQNHEKDFIVPNENGTFSDENLIFILRYMQENYNHISMKALAEFFNYSERHMQRIINTYTGMSFNKNILNLRMNRSTMLLTKSNMPVAQIASEVGYSDVSNFRQIFKKVFHMTPIEYREKYKYKD